VAGGWRREHNEELRNLHTSILLSDQIVISESVMLHKGMYLMRNFDVISSFKRC
jgi:hypothetical protein